MKTDPEFLALAKILQDADTVFAHEEGVIHNYEYFCSRPLEIYMLPWIDPVMVHEFKWLGIDMMSCAGNHGGEWGERARAQL